MDFLSWSPPIWVRRASPSSFSCRASSRFEEAGSNSERFVFICAGFSSWQTTSPVGIWVMQMALLVVLTDCPPGPDEQPG